ncbi:hypothetical protein [Vibrio parahaemolyticus]|uniref:hypothetical protein n=1 Tax=Vibrio parahaemolyticus TaxID=670 RepID=UPI001D165394|nr:hypothetical protein [Vibrio parahaemolyticus]MCC3836255.1 hypothetical protein [Vibrio parahaemolyticus]
MENFTIPAKEVAESRAKALEKIKHYLGAADIEGQFSNLDGNYYSSEKFLVTWSGNHQGIPAEFKIEKCDPAYQAMSGFCCIYGHAGLFHEKQIEGFGSFERALIVVGLKLCPTREAKIEFFNKYAVPYNEKIKASEAQAKEATK